MIWAISALGLLVGVVALAAWYRREDVLECDADVQYQSEHEHFHLHVDLPAGLEVEAGDTLEILETPPTPRTSGELTYRSRIRLHKASLLKRTLIRRSSLLEVKELVEHP